MIDALIYLLIIVTISTVSDALRDRWRSLNANVLDWSYPKAGYFRPWHWWRWHIVKWINLYTPHGFIVYLLWPHLEWYELALTAALMFFVWRRIYNQGA